MRMAVILLCLQYGSLTKHFGFYGAYHNNVVNQWIHIIW